MVSKYAVGLLFCSCADIGHNAQIVSDRFDDSYQKEIRKEGIQTFSDQPVAGLHQSNQHGGSSNQLAELARLLLTVTNPVALWQGIRSSHSSRTGCTSTRSPCRRSAPVIMHARKKVSVPPGLFDSKKSSAPAERTKVVMPPGFVNSQSVSAPPDRAKVSMPPGFLNSGSAAASPDRAKVSMPSGFLDSGSLSAAPDRAKVGMPPDFVSPTAESRLTRYSPPFVPYSIDPQYDEEYFSGPQDRNVVGVHANYSEGVAATELTEADGLQEAVPELNLSFPGLKVVHLDPPVLTIDNFLSDAECEELVALQFADASSVKQEASRTEGDLPEELGEWRSSTTWRMAFQRVPNLIAKGAALLGVDNIGRFEDPQLVRYRPGEFFNQHWDAFGPRPANGGYRRATLLIYLNDVKARGRTAFEFLRAGGIGLDGKPSPFGENIIGGPLPVQVSPKKGRAMLFFNTRGDGTPDRRMLHLAEKVAGGEKWLVQLWLHETMYTSKAPEGSSQAAAAPAVLEFAEKNGLRPIDLKESTQVPKTQPMGGHEDWLDVVKQEAKPKIRAEYIKTGFKTEAEAETVAQTEAENMAQTHAETRAQTKKKKKSKTKFANPPNTKGFR